MTQSLKVTVLFYRDDPVGPSCKSCVEELAFYSETRIYGQWLDTKEGQNLDLVDMRHSLQTLQVLLDGIKPTEVLNCDQVVSNLYCM